MGGIGLAATGIGYYMGQVLDDREALVKSRLESDNKDFRGKLLRAHSDLCFKEQEIMNQVEQAHANEQESASEALAIQLQGILPLQSWRWRTG